MYTADDHTFAICAYGDSPFLPECIDSLLAQRQLGRVLLATSTPSEYLRAQCAQHDIPMFVNDKQEGISADWNFAYRCSETRMVTIVHQDDTYEPGYLDTLLRLHSRRPDAIMLFTNYFEIRGGKRVDSNYLLRIKRVLTAPLRLPVLWRAYWARRLMMAFGNPVSCPSVCYVRDNIPFDPVFDVQLHNNCDYEAYLRLSVLSGSFIYAPEVLVGHRIHPDSATSRNIRNKVREQEDYHMLRLLWPKPMADFIFRFYKKGQESNELEREAE